MNRDYTVLGHGDPMGIQRPDQADATLMTTARTSFKLEVLRLMVVYDKKQQIVKLDCSRYETAAGRY